MVPYVSEDWFEEIIKTPPPTQDPSLRPNIDGNPPKDILSEQSDTYEAAPEPVPNASYSGQPASKKPYAAPTAPRAVANNIDASLLPLVEPFRPWNLQVHCPTLRSTPRIQPKRATMKRTTIVLPFPFK